MTRPARPCVAGVLAWAACTLTVATTARAQPGKPANVAGAIAEIEHVIARLEQHRIIGWSSEQVDADVKRVMALVAKAADLAQRTLTDALARQKRRPTAEIKAAVRLLRAQQCYLALLRGDVHLAAGIALRGEAKAKQAYFDKAVGLFRATRVEHVNVPTAWLGYLGEARAQCAARRTAEANAALQPVLELRSGGLAVNKKGVEELHLEALLIKLEILLTTSPKEAISQAAEWRKAKGFEPPPAWSARADWALARAWAGVAKQAGGASPKVVRDAVARSAALARSKAVRGQAAEYDRLALLMALDKLSGGKTITREELLAWADMQLSLGREAVDLYRRADKMDATPLSSRQYCRVAVALARREDWAGCADACDAALRHAPGDSPHIASALQLRARATWTLYKAAPQEPFPTAHARRAEEALLALVAHAAAPHDVRRDALRQWVSVRSRRTDLAACVPALDQHKPLVVGDPYLLYSRAAGMWLAFGARSDRRDTPETKTRATTIAAAAAAALAAADKAKNLPLAARSCLLQASVEAAAPLARHQAALATLQRGRAALKADPPSARAAAWLEMATLLEIGLTDSALEVAESLEDKHTAASAATMVRLAGALAQRYSAGDAATRRRVVRLCNRAMAAALSTPSYSATVESAARALIRVGATVDATTLLRRLQASTDARADKSAYLRRSLLLAEAITQGGARAEARKLLADLAKDYPGRADVAMAAGRVEMTLKEPQRAVTMFRRARGLTRAGSAPWCDATLALARALRAGGHESAAVDILRVARALHPSFGNPELLRQSKELLGPSRPPRGKNGDGL